MLQDCRLETRVGEIAARRRIAGNRGKLRRRPPLDAMIEIAEIGTVEVDAMDQAGLQVGDIEHAAAGIEGQPAEARPAVFHAVDLNIREQRDRAGTPIDLPDRARSAAVLGAELPLHPHGVGLSARQSRLGRAWSGGDAQAECRAGRDIDVGHAGPSVGSTAIVERDAEDLADLGRRDLEPDRRRKAALIRGAAQSGDVDNAQRRAIDIDERRPGVGRTGTIPEKPVTAN